MSLQPVFDAFGLSDPQLLGQGSEAQVYALDAGRVLRISRGGGATDWILRRNTLLHTLARSAHLVPFAIPTILDITEIAGHTVTIERRLPGRPLPELLAEATGPRRTALVRAYLDAAAQIGDLRLDVSWYGDLNGADPLRTATFREYLALRAARSLAQSGWIGEQMESAGLESSAISPTSLAAAWPEPDAPALVHLDAFPGNMLADAERITAIVDFGSVSLSGDRRLDPLTAAVYLTPAITPMATDTDRATAREWLIEQQLDHLFAPARRWIAAFWSFAADDPPLHQWCRSVLLS